MESCVFWTRKLYTIIKYFGLDKMCYHVGRFLSSLVTDGEPSTSVIKIIKNKTSTRVIKIIENKTYQHTHTHI